MRHLDPDCDAIGLGNGVQGPLNLPREQLSDPISGIGRTKPLPSDELVVDIYELVLKNLRYEDLVKSTGQLGSHWHSLPYRPRTPGTDHRLGVARSRTPHMHGATQVATGKRRVLSLDPWIGFGLIV
jgi:hypothetical protein